MVGLEQGLFLCFNYPLLGFVFQMQSFQVSLIGIYTKHLPLPVDDWLPFPKPRNYQTSFYSNSVLDHYIR